MCQQVEEAETQTSGGLVLTSTSREQPTLGKVKNLFLELKIPRNFERQLSAE